MNRVCKKHPRYKGKGAPQLACANCWWIWFYIGRGLKEKP